MFDQFTKRARKVVGMAHQEACRLNHDYIGTEHILLGFVHLRTGVTANALKNLNVDRTKIRKEVKKLAPKGKRKGTKDHLFFTPRAKRVLELAVEEAIHRGHHEVLTEHILCGLFKEKEGKAAKVLLSLDIELETVQKQIELLKQQPKP